MIFLLLLLLLLPPIVLVVMMIRAPMGMEIEGIGFIRLDKKGENKT